MLEDDTGHEEISASECFGDFWHDIFNLKIMTEEDEEKRENDEKIRKEAERKPKEESKENPKSGEDEGFSNYIRQIVLYNLTPKVNLMG